MKAKILLVGDIHGKVPRLLAIANQNKDKSVIQLGDFGFGFMKIGELPTNLRMIRGNHDAPEAARKHPNYLGDYGTFMLNDKKVFFLGGAYSIDYAWRTPGESWWEDEELSYPELEQAFEKYKAYKPDIVLTHEAPRSIVPEILDRFVIGKLGNRDYKAPCADSRTSQSLQKMWEEHQPEQWYFGHYHINGVWVTKPRLEANNTTFQCLDELQTKEIS